MGSYRVLKVLGKGGFGITYLAEHMTLSRLVALKELLPVDFATRDVGDSVVPVSDEAAKDFAWALRRFLDEARNIALCQHPNVLRVFDVFEANGTAYMPTSYEEGRTLTQWSNEPGRAPSESELLAILMPLLDGLETVHSLGLLHRDIKPDNIYIRTNGSPVLLDFGAAREAVGSRSRSITTIVTPGYAGIEQYSSDEAGEAGPASDLYALGATLYRVLTGERPVEAPRRISRGDPLVPLSIRLEGHYSAALLSALDACMAVMEHDRPQSVDALRQLLGGREEDGEPLFVDAGNSEEALPEDLTVLHPAAAPPLPMIRPKSNGWVLWTVAGLAVLGAVIMGGLALRPRPAEKLGGNAGTPPSNNTPQVAAPTAQPPKPAPSPTPPAVQPAPVTLPAPAPKVVDLHDAIANATREQPYVNTLGMRFVPVKISAGPRQGQVILFSIWETRSKDYATFLAVSSYTMTGEDPTGWRTAETNGLPVGRGAGERAEDSSHPVCNVSYTDANEFCAWLTKKERLAGILKPGESYALPTDLEWSEAVGCSLGDAISTPAQRHNAGTGEYPWHTRSFPPPGIVGNYADESAKARQTAKFGSIEGYDDQWATTSVAGVFPANGRGLYDLGGNVWEWCEDKYDTTSGFRVLRGGCWISGEPKVIGSTYRNYARSAARSSTWGFRCVLIPSVAPRL